MKEKDSLNSLTNNQIILLTLLVSFVTSIATGIVTVTLLEQAPQGVTQTINRVVERTIETVVPTGVKETLIQERVVIKDQEEFVVNAVARTQKAFVNISSAGAEPAKIATGIHLAGGFVLVPILDILDLNHEALALTFGGQTVDLKRIAQDEGAGLAVFKLKEPENSRKETTSAPEGIRLSVLETHPGQTAIVVGKGSVHLGIISNVVSGAEGTTVVIEANGKGLGEGIHFSVIMDTREEAIGFYVGGKQIGVETVRTWISAPAATSTAADIDPVRKGDELSNGVDKQT